MRKPRQRIAVSTKRAQLRRIRARMAHVLHLFFIRQRGFIIGQVLTLRGKTVKAEMSDEELQRIEDIIAGIDFYGWTALAGDVDDIIAEAAQDGGYEALRLIGMDITAEKDVFNVVNELAVSYAQKRSAELVGMRRGADGALIENPNPEFAITESTRDMLRTDIADALKEGWTNAELAQRLEDSYAFSAERAMVIARTETIRASNAGTLDGFKSSGVVLKKEWTTAEDDLVSEDCQENGDQGPIDLDESFASGDDAPPAHPNCRCSIVGLTELDTVEEPVAPEEQEA